MSVYLIPHVDLQRGFSEEQIVFICHEVLQVTANKQFFFLTVVGFGVHEWSWINSSRC